MEGGPWDDHVDEVLAGDLTVALAYATPTGGAAVLPISTFGLRDRAAGTIGFTTSLGFGRKLDRIHEDPRVAIAYHARDHGMSTSPCFVLAQGVAAPVPRPSPELLANLVRPQAQRFMGPPKQGRLFWDRWLREYYQDRVLVTVRVERVVCWPDLRCEGRPQACGAARRADPPLPQRPPRAGAGPRLDVGRAARRLGRHPHVLVAFIQADGYPTAVPVGVGAALPGGLVLEAAEGLLPPGGRRAGLLGHSYRPRLVGLSMRHHFGWLDVDQGTGRALYTPHTDWGYSAPANRALLLLVNGFFAKRGVRAARASRERLLG